MTNPEQINIAYVAGYGRSGSTLLERILAIHPEVTGLGEIAYLADTELGEFYWDVVSESGLWQKLEPQLRRSPEETAVRERIQKKSESRLTGWWHWLFGPSKEYREQTLEIVSDISGAAGTRWLIDSSKTARDRFFRPFQLRKTPGVNLRMLHLVRDPRGCVHSVRNGSNAAMERGAPRVPSFATLRASTGWIFANLSGLLFRLRYGRENYVRIRFEELVSNPRAALSRVESVLDLDFEAVESRIRENQPLPVSDQFAGNRMRLASVIRLQTKHRWKQEMPRLLQWFVLAVCSPIAVWVLRRDPSVSEKAHPVNRAA